MFEISTRQARIRKARKQAATESLPYYSTRLKCAPELVSALDRFVNK
jgi:hypothetical protein